MTRRVLPFAYLAAAGLGGVALAGAWAWLCAVGLALLAFASLRLAPRLWPLVSGVAAAAVFLAWRGGNPGAVSLAAAAAALVVLLAFGDNRRWRLVTVAAVAVPIAAVGALAVREQWMEQAHTLVALATGLAWATGVFWALWDRVPAREVGDPPSPSIPEQPDVPMFPGLPRLGSRSQWHGWTLVLIGATLPLGEGAAFGAGGACLLLLILRRHAVPAGLLTGERRALVLAFAVWIGMALLAAVLSGHFLLEPRELGRLGPFVLVPLVFLSVASLPAVWLDRAAKAFLIVLAVACLVAVGQYGLNLIDHPMGESLSAWLLKGSQSRVPGTTDDVVAGGFFRHRLKMAHVAVLGLTVLFGRQLLVPLSSRRRALEGALLVLFFVTLLLTFTRGAILGVGAAVAIAIWVGARKWRLRAAVAVALCAVGALSVPTVRQRVASIASPSTGSDRAFIWAMSAQVTGEHPLGIGLANYPTYSATYYDAAETPYKFVPRTYPHSLVMAAWAESGPLGLGGYVAMWMALLLIAVSGLRRRGDTRDTSAAAALLLTVVAFWVIGVTHDVLFHKPVALTFSAIVGACLAQLRARGSQT